MGRAWAIEHGDDLMSNPIDRFRNVLRNRVDIAARWHGLKKWDDIYDFAMQDPDIAALWDDKQVQRQIIVEAIAIILDHADADLDGCRKRFGPQLVDLVVSGRNRFLTKQEEDEDGQ